MAPLIGPVQPPTVTTGQTTSTQKQEKTPKEKCEDKGWVWDEATRTCKRPTTTSPEREKELFGEVGAEPKPTKIITDERGRQTGVELPSGRTLLNLGREDIEKITGRATGEVIGAEEAAQQEVIGAERERISREEAPSREELLLEPSGLEQLPVVGPLLSKLFDLVPFQDEEAKTKLKIDPIEQKTLALTEISKQEIERGLTANEKFGEWVEAIPIVGSLVAKYASGLIETPSSNTREIVKNVLAERRRLTNIETNVKLGYMSIADAQIQVADIEENIVRLESRMKLLINNSPQLKFNSDGVNTIETKILQTKEKILQAKQNILTGQTNDPTELQMFQQLSLTSEAEE